MGVLCPQLVSHFLGEPDPVAHFLTQVKTMLMNPRIWYVGLVLVLMGPEQTFRSDHYRHHVCRSVRPMPEPLHCMHAIEQLAWNAAASWSGALITSLHIACWKF